MLFEAFLAQLLAQLPATPPTTAPTSTVSPCPDDMLFVEGTHFESIQRLCINSYQGHCFSFFPGLVAAEPAITQVRTCMDRYEWPNHPGTRPTVMLRFVEAESKCKSVGKRLCTEFEWEMACEGPSMLPFPYGYGHNKDACNVSKPYMPVSERKLLSEDPNVRHTETQRVWQGEPSGTFPRCISHFGVIDMVGNVEEWVTTSRAEWPYRSSLKGGFWAKPWAGCRGTNDSHGPMFRFYEIGFRCCKDPELTP